DGERRAAAHEGTRRHGRQRPGPRGPDRPRDGHRADEADEAPGGDPGGVLEDRAGTVGQEEPLGEIFRAMNDDKTEQPADAGAAPATESAPIDWKAKADEYLELARRAKADFINYQDRVRRDKADWNRQALEGFVREILPALDGFGLANFEEPKLNEAV